MTRKAVLVLGPEASGTRLVTRIVIAAGYAGNSDHVQYYDWQPPKEDQIVWRRSLPHGNAWPDLGSSVRELRRDGYEVRAVLTNRLDEPMQQAQRRDHVTDIRVAKQHIARARIILAQLDDPQGPAMPILRVQYEELVADSEGEINAILQFVDGDLSQIAHIARAVRVYDGNAQYGVRPEIGEGVNA